MKNFLLKCVIFIAPIVAIFIFPFFVFFVSGEFLPTSTVVDRQFRDNTALYQSAFTSATEKPYKLLSTIKRNPEIIALGLSRVLTFRSDFFKDEKTFYNAGRGIYGSTDLVPYLNQIPSNSNLKIIAIDVSSLFDDTAENHIEPISSFFDIVGLFFRSGWRDAYIDYFSHKFSLGQIIGLSKTNSSIGLSALINNTGYRSDGSLNRGNDFSALDNRKALGALAIQVKENIPVIENSFFISKSNLSDIEEFLKLAQKRNIYVIGYFSPYAKGIYDEIKSSRNIYLNNFREAPLTFISLFNKYDYHFYDFRDISVIGSSDKELYDAEHQTEKGTLRLLLYLTNHEPKLLPFVDISSIYKKIVTEHY